MWGAPHETFSFTRRISVHAHMKEINTVYFMQKPSPFQGEGGLRHKPQDG